MFGMGLTARSYEDQGKRGFGQDRRRCLAVIRTKVRKVLRFRMEVKDRTEVKARVRRGQEGREAVQACRPARVQSTLSR